MSIQAKSNIERVLDDILSVKKKSLIYSEPAESTIIGCYKLLLCYNSPKLEEALGTENGVFILAYITGGKSASLKEIKDAYKSIYSINLRQDSLSSYINKFIEAGLISKEDGKYTSHFVMPQDCK